MQHLREKPRPGTQLNLSHPLNRGLVGCWLMNEGSGIRAFDSSPYKNHGTLINMAVPSCRSSHGLAFDGVNDYVSTPLDVSSDAFTLSCWINSQYLNSADNNRGILNKREPTFEWRFTQINSKVLRFTAHDDAAANTMDTVGVTPLTNNLWYHAVLTYNGTNTKLFINGKLDGTGSGNPIRDTASPIVIGRDGAFASRYFIGTIDEVRIFNRVLSASEIKLLYLNPYDMFMGSRRGE